MLKKNFPDILALEPRGWLTQYQQNDIASTSLDNSRTPPLSHGLRI
jgi:hypothetical protein